MSNLMKGSGRKRILCYPHYPSRGATIYRIAKELGIELSNKPTGKFDLVIYWEYATERKEWDLLEGFTTLQVINLQSRNIGKDYLDHQMRKAFGYSTQVDPQNYDGKVVKKSIQNAVHDGMFVEAPFEKEVGFIYQRLVDSSVSESEVMDMRIPVMNKFIPHLYRAYRSSNERFVNVPPRVELETNVDAMISPEEKNNLFKLCDSMGLDYVEFDVLRDCIDDRIYVVDANNTPQGPPKNLSDAEKRQSIESYARCFKQQFLS
ncbi:MAG: hypothetical protein R2813_11455 [Flavobacteriales bacterium]